MGKCKNHPDRETNFLCMKHNVYMCEECVHCNDNEIYCKFRPSCPIWFMEKQMQKEQAPEIKEKAISHKVLFKPAEKEITVPEGSTLLDAARAADVPINASCNGAGVCGKCRLVLESGKVEGEPSPLLSDEEKAQNYILACQTRVYGDVTVKIPEETQEMKLKVAGMGEAATAKLKGTVKEIRPMLFKLSFELPYPTMDDPVSDLTRLHRGLKKMGCDINKLTVGLPVLRQLAASLREGKWRITASIVNRNSHREILHVDPEEETTGSLGLAVDIGTTSVVAYLVDMTTGDILAATSAHNRQAACGDDVINRIVCAEKDGVKKLSAMVLSTINGLINELVDSINVTKDLIDNVVVSGNTTMTHLLLKIEPRYIRREPYIPSVSAFPILKAGNVGLKVNPIAAIYIMPGPASYVGGDIVSGLLYAGIHREDPLSLFIDVGTNGEIVLGNKDWMLTAACSAGPAFEGGNVRWGMRAEEGAVEKVTIDPESLRPSLSTVEDVRPRGICGSGMIDLISEMLLTGIIGPDGKFQLPPDHPRIFQDESETAYIVAYADETPMEKDIIFSESDIANIMRSKAAVYAGFNTLLKHAGLDFSMVERMIITGGFGQYLDIEKAIVIGLLPDIDHDKFIYLGNSSIAGAYMALLSETYRGEALQISNSMTYMDFSSSKDFMDEFTSAQFLPHTDLNAFPSVKKKFK